jgi:hypothetical protein
MTDDYEAQDTLSLNRETEDLIHQIIMACGVRPLKEKVSILYLSIDYIFAHNKDLLSIFCDEVTIH